MARPKLTVRPREKTISLPEPLVEEVDRILHSELEGRVPHGEWSRYVSELILQDLLKRKALVKSMENELNGLS